MTKQLVQRRNNPTKNILIYRLSLRKDSITFIEFNTTAGLYTVGETRDSIQLNDYAFVAEVKTKKELYYLEHQLTTLLHYTPVTFFGTVGAGKPYDVELASQAVKEFRILLSCSAVTSKPLLLELTVGEPYTYRTSDIEQMLSLPTLRIALPTKRLYTRLLNHFATTITKSLKSVEACGIYSPLQSEDCH